MGIESLYADGIEAGIQRQLRAPTAPPEQSFSIGSFLGAGFKSPAAGALETIGSTADLLSGFATPLAASSGDDEARRKMLAGESFDVAAGNVLRRKADTFMPNPETSHRADQVLAGLGRGVSKAVGYIGTMGPAGALPFALDEGNTTTQNLRSQGIDTATAAKVGAVWGVASGIGAVVPLGGQTIAQTAALVVGSGPVTFMAQEALSRDILAKASYADEAAKHDPLDPLGLAISTVLPGVFGGFHMRGVAKRGAALEAGTIPLQQMTPAERGKLKYNAPELDAYAVQAAEANGVPPAILLAIKNAGERSNSNQTSPVGAQGVMQFMPATAREMGIADPRDPAQSIDGAARYMRKLFDAYGSWDAAVAHYNGGGSQAAIVRSGGKPTYPETAAYLERVQKYAAEHAAETGARNPDVVDAARVRVTNDALARSMPDAPNAHAEVIRASDEVAAGRMPEVEPVPTTALPEFREWFGESVVRDEAGAPQVVYHGTGREFESFETSALGSNTGVHDAREGFFFSTSGKDASEYAWKDGEPGSVLPVYLNIRNPFVSDMVVHAGNNREFAEVLKKAKREGHDGVAAFLDTFGRESTVYVAFDPKQIKSATGNSGKFDPNSASLTDPLQPGERNPRVPARSEGTNALPEPASVTIQPEAPAVAAPAPKAAGDGPTPPSLDSQRVAAIAEADPGLKVRLPGSDETLTVGEALERARAEAKEEAGFAKLVQAATECALGYGA